jgi:hypothetical protein
MVCLEEENVRTRLPLILAAAGLAAMPALALAAPKSVAFVSEVTSAKQTGPKYTATADLFRGKTKIGKAAYACKADAKGDTCAGTIKATTAGGTLRMTYTYISAKPAQTKISVVGGSGVYAGAKGTGTYMPLNAGDSRQAIKLMLR